MWKICKNNNLRKIRLGFMIKNWRLRKMGHEFRLGMLKEFLTCKFVKKKLLWKARRTCMTKLI